MPGHVCAMPHPKQEFSQIWDLCQQASIDKAFQFIPFPEKNNDNFFEKYTKTLFWAHFCPFWAFSPKLEFSQKIRLCHF